MSSKGYLVAAGAVLFGCVLLAQSRDTARSHQKRDAESLYSNIYSAIAEFTANDASMPSNDKMMKDAPADTTGNVRTKRNRLSTGGQNFAALQAGASAQLPRGCKFKAKSKDKLKVKDDFRVDDDDDSETSFFTNHSRHKRASFLQNLFFGGGGGGGGDGSAETTSVKRPKRPPRPPRPPFAPSPLGRLPRMPPKAKSQRPKSGGPTGLGLQMQLLSQSGSLEQRYKNAPKAKRQSLMPLKMQKFSQLMLMRKAIASGMAADKEVRNVVATAVAKNSKKQRPPPLHRPNVVNPNNPFLRKKKPPTPRIPGPTLAIGTLPPLVRPKDRKKHQQQQHQHQQHNTPPSPTLSSPTSFSILLSTVTPESSSSTLSSLPLLSIPSNSPQELIDMIKDMITVNRPQAGTDFRIQIVPEAGASPRGQPTESAHASPLPTTGTPPSSTTFNSSLAFSTISSPIKSKSKFKVSEVINGGFFPNMFGLEGQKPKAREQQKHLNGNRDTLIGARGQEQQQTASSTMTSTTTARSNFQIDGIFEGQQRQRQPATKRPPPAISFSSTFRPMFDDEVQMQLPVSPRPMAAPPSARPKKPTRPTRSHSTFRSISSFKRPRPSPLKGQNSFQNSLQSPFKQQQQQLSSFKKRPKISKSPSSKPAMTSFQNHFRTSTPEPYLPFLDVFSSEPPPEDPFLPVVNVFIEKMRETRGNRQKAASLSVQSFSDYDDDDDAEYLDRGFPQHLNRGFAQQTRQGLGTLGDFDNVITDGFPTGLPAGTPLGVRIALASTAELSDDEMPPIPGVAGVDFPVLTEIPQTGFDCAAQDFPGIYADMDADCQVFYMCQPNGNFNSFLCPNGTMFNQQYFICDWWYNVDCGASANFYQLNQFLYEDNPSAQLVENTDDYNNY